MKTENLINLHFAYMSFVRHWDATSEAFTGGDALFTFLSEGWSLDETVTYEEYWLSGVRPITIYYFTLEKDDQKLNMPVITNPYVRRVVSETGVKLEALGEKKTSRAAR